MAELDEAERAELAHLERELLAVEDIVQFRALAKVRIMAEEAAHREAAESTPKPRKTWYEWATGGSSASGAAEEVPFAINFAEGAIELSDDQRATLAALLSGGAEAVSTPRQTAAAEYVEHTLQLACAKRLLEPTLELPSRPSLPPIRCPPRQSPC
jgi:hypothetical protein